MSRPRRPDAILFDVYETLFTNEPADWHKSFQKISDEQGLGLDGREFWLEWKRHEVAFREWRTNMAAPAKSPPFKNYEKAWKECFEKVFKEREITGDAAAAARRAVEHMSRREPYPETFETLSLLSGRSRLGVFSNADEAFLRPMLDGEGLTSKFEVVVSSESACVYKPHPDAFRHILRLMDLAPGSVWYVGDHLYDDILGGSTAGVTTVWINRTGLDAPAEGAQPDHIVTNLLGLVDLYDRSS